MLSDLFSQASLSLLPILRLPLKESWFDKTVETVFIKLIESILQPAYTAGPLKSPVTELLLAWEQGDELALERLMRIVEGELRAMAKGYLQGEKDWALLQTTDLVNEAYIRITNQRRVHWKNRKHFFAIAATCMRRALLDHIRSENRKRRGAGAERVDLADASAISPERSTELLALDEALRKLEKQDPRKGQIIEMRYFGGYSEEEVAEFLEVSKETVERDSRLARAWLNANSAKPETYLNKPGFVDLRKAVTFSIRIGLLA